MVHYDLEIDLTARKRKLNRQRNIKQTDLLKKRRIENCICISTVDPK